MSASETTCDTPRPSLLLPPTGPLVRQRATGAESPRAAEIVWPDRTPEYYDRISLADCGSPLSFETVNKLMRVVLPNVRPYVKFVPRSDLLGRTFSLVLHDAHYSLPKDMHPIEEFGISDELAWEYIACDYIRHLYLGKSPFKISKYKTGHINAVLSLMTHFNALHDSLARAILS